MKSFIKIFWIILLLFCFINYLNPSTTDQRDSIFKTAEIKLDKKTETPAEIRFNDGNQISVSSFFQEYKSHFQLSEENSFKPFKVFTDQLGQTHYRYKQYYKGIELAEIQYLLHEKKGSVFYAHGRLIHNLDLEVIPELSESEALKIAMNHIDANSYMWENNDNENYLKKIQSDQNTTFHPKSELKISAGTEKKITANFRLVHRFDIFAKEPLGRYDVDIDAKTGEIIGVISRLYYDDFLGQGISEYNGIVPITVWHREFNDFLGGWHLTNWNAYFGNGESWWMADPELGNAGGYDNLVYLVLDTDPVTLTGNDLTLSFFHRLASVRGDGCNVRISKDGGETWEVLLDPSRPYSRYGEGLNCFKVFGEGSDVPGWDEEIDWWTYVRFDLLPYVGETVQLRFVFASGLYDCTADRHPDRFGWQIDEILVSNSIDTLFSNHGNSSGMTPSMIERDKLFTNDLYYLRDYSRGEGIITLNSDYQSNREHSVDFFDDDGNFTDAKAGVSVHWATEVIYDYFLDKHGRSSYDDTGGILTSYVNYFAIVHNYAAFYSGNGIMTFRAADSVNSSPFVSLDIVGHEFTHGVIQESADLVYQYESGALNESFADIFGGVVHFQEQGNLGTRLCGSILDTYLGVNWYVGEDDNGGVHSNSGVQNKWFCLLSEGGTGTNDHGFSYSVTGIGVEDAAQIAYRNLTVYLMPNSYHYDSRIGAMNAAIDLFGNDSPQYQNVVDAWDAVGVMPVIPTLFELSEDNSEVTIRWQTISESDSNIWIIERKETDSETKNGYEQIAEIENRGTRYTGVDYEYVDNTVLHGHRYTYRLGYVPSSGDNTHFQEKEIFVGTPKVFALQQNYPNPFNSETTIPYDLPWESLVTLQIYDILGQEVFTLPGKRKKEGTQDFIWDGRNNHGISLASGIYIFHMDVVGDNGEKFSGNKKMILIR